MVPRPQQVEFGGGECEYRDSTARFVLDSACGMPSEGYRLEISAEGVVCRATDSAGLFYGQQTLRQLMMDSSSYDVRRDVWRLPVVTITDAPRFAYRGMHLDVSRHFFPVTFIRRYLDLMSQYKYNVFHWHLTDAGGWRMEVPGCPELVEKGAWRTEEDWRQWWIGGDRRYAEAATPGAYGGYYTVQEMRDIVAYAAERHIKVIPEIEMPGHSEEVVHVYPELGCAGTDGHSGEMCAGKEETFAFIERVLTAAMDIFPSEHIHVGGDEAGKAHWKKCPYCQERMRREHLKDVSELQSYFMRRIGKFILSKGRQMVGWDEILEGGLADDAVVMSWRGEKGGVAAARDGHDVVMTPGGYCYFDAYQADPATQPYAIGGYTPYLKVYSYDPVPAELSEDESKYVLGAQANVWTEFIATPEHVEYMVFPRMAALAEVLWTRQELRDTDDFKRRAESHILWQRGHGVNAFTLSDHIDMTAAVDTVGKRITVSFDNEKYRPEIRYTTDGTMPDSASQRYVKPIVVNDSAVIRAALFTKGLPSALVSEGRFDYHRAIGKRVAYRKRYSGAYPAGGEATLTDGYRGGLTYGDGRWQGFLNDVDVVVDMGEACDLHYVSTKFMQLTGPGVFMPKYVEVSVSDDGETFRPVGRVMNDVPSGCDVLTFKDFTIRFTGHGRYVRLLAAHQSGFMFVDEVVVY